MVFNRSKTFRSMPKPQKILFAKENIKFGWHRIAQQWEIGKGMFNLGNSCYINSTIQALFHIPSFAHWLLTDEKHRKKSFCKENDYCLICAMAITLKATQDYDDDEFAIRPQLITDRLKDICQNLTPGRQEDAHEFLRHLIEALNETFLQRHIDNMYLDEFSKSTTPVNQIFGGFFRSTIKCKDCGYKSENFEQFMELSLDITNSPRLTDAIHKFFALEHLDGESYECGKCRRKVSATKQTQLETSPTVLCIQLKRFEPDGTKLRSKIQVQLHLNLSQYFSQSADNNQQTDYKLVSLVSHIGSSSDSGHYSAVGLAPNGMYYTFDDSKVEKRKINEELIESNAYFLFYEIKDKRMSSVRTSSSF